MTRATGRVDNREFLPAKSANKRADDLGEGNFWVSLFQSWREIESASVISIQDCVEEHVPFGREGGAEQRIDRVATALLDLAYQPNAFCP